MQDANKFEHVLACLKNNYIFIRIKLFSVIDIVIQICLYLWIYCLLYARIKLRSFFFFLLKISQIFYFSLFRSQGSRNNVLKTISPFWISIVSRKSSSGSVCTLKKCKQIIISHWFRVLFCAFALIKKKYYLPGQ